MIHDNSFADPSININSGNTLETPPPVSFGLHSPRNPRSANQSMPSISSVPPKVRWTRMGILLIGMIFLAVGREAVPDHDVTCIVDRLMNVFDGINAYVLSSPFLRN